MFLSIIIPCYNVEKYVSQCLDSVFGQTCNDFEVICVDNGSTDSTPQILKDYATAHPIQIVTQENVGVSAARNAGFARATGDYVYYLDSDDFIEPGLVEECKNFCLKETVDILFFNSRYVVESDIIDKKLKEKNGTVIQKHTYSTIVSGKELFTAMISDSEYRPWVWTKIYRTDFLKKHSIKYIEGIYHEDDYFSFMAMMKSQKAGHLNQVMHNYRLRNNSIMRSSYTVKNVYGLAYTVKIVLKELNNESFTENQYWALKKWFGRELKWIGNFARASKFPDIKDISPDDFQLRILYDSFMEPICKMKDENRRLERMTPKGFLRRVYHKIKSIFKIK